MRLPSLLRSTRAGLPLCALALFACAGPSAGEPARIARAYDALSLLLTTETAALQQLLERHAALVRERETLIAETTASEARQRALEDLERRLESSRTELALAVGLLEDARVRAAELSQQLDTRAGELAVDEARARELAERCEELVAVYHELARQTEEERP